jgi:hypothetical protein
LTAALRSGISQIQIKPWPHGIIGLNRMADPSQTTAESRNDYANRIAKVTTNNVLIEVRHAFRTMPAPEFDTWLVKRLEQAERMQEQING